LLLSPDKTRLWTPTTQFPSTISARRPQAPNLVATW